MTDVRTSLVAAVIPARPEEPFLAEALNSVQRQPEVADIVVATHIADSATARPGPVDARESLPVRGCWSESSPPWRI